MLGRLTSAMTIHLGNRSGVPPTALMLAILGFGRKQIGITLA